MTDATEPTWDALVLGAGPAGCAAANVLAQHGRSVLILEKQPFPRERIGESLIPFCWFPLERMGVVECIAQSSFVSEKFSVQFASTTGKISKPYYFFQHYDHPSSTTWQVRRPEFDQVLLDSATHRGAQVRMGWTARELLKDEHGQVIGVRAKDSEGALHDLHARVTVDATGREALAQARERWRVQDDKLKKVAIWTYYEGSKRDPGLDANATTVAYLPEKGWFWYLPLANDRVSVGVVAEPDYLYRAGETRDPKEIFLREVQQQPWIQAHLEGGRMLDAFEVTRDFSYRSRHCAADGLVLVGDAFAFLDPVFSSGVFFALHSGVQAADAIHAALEAGDVSAERFREYGEDLCKGHEPMRNLVHAFYDQTFNFGAFLRDHPDHREGITDVLIGNLYKDFDAMWQDMAKFAELPQPLEHGAPAS